MARNTLLWRTLAIGGSLALVLSACGGDDTTEPAETEDAAAEATDDAAAGSGDGTLTIGTLLPQTGQLAFLGPPMITGTQLAVEEINDAGGVLGNEVEKVDADEGDEISNIVAQSADTLLNEGVEAIVGAAASGQSNAVLDRITGAGVVMVSPSNTSPAFTTADDNGLYFRTAPSDVLQGRTLGDRILEDGIGSVAILARQDSYGEGLANKIAETVQDGGAEVVYGPEFYAPDDPDFETAITEAADSGAEAFVVVSFDEIASIVPAAVSRNFGPQDVPWYLVDGNMKNFSTGDFQLDEGTMEGTVGTIPGQALDEGFIDRLNESRGEDLDDLTFAGQAYDAVILLALAAEAAGDVSSEAIAAQLPAVSAPEGTECFGFAECRDLLAEGEEIDYQGQSGPIDLDDVGDPSSATIGIFQYGPDNTFEQIAEVEGQL